MSENEELKARAERAEKACAEKDATLDSLSKSVTMLALAIDPTATHGPEATKIVYFLRAQRMNSELERLALRVALEKSRCSCYQINPNDADGGSLKLVKCARCEALETFTSDYGKDYVSRAELDKVQEGLQKCQAALLGTEAELKRVREVAKELVAALKAARLAQWSPTAREACDAALARAKEIGLE